MSTPTASEILAGIENLFKRGGHETWNGQLPHAKDLFAQGMQLDWPDDLFCHPTFIRLRYELDLVDRPNTETDEKMLQALGLTGPAECLPLNSAEQKRQAADNRIIACADLIRNMKEKESSVVDVTPMTKMDAVMAMSDFDNCIEVKKLEEVEVSYEKSARLYAKQRDKKRPVDIAAVEPEPGLIDTAEAERMLALLGIDKVIACAYGSTNLFTPRRQGDRYDWEKVPSNVDWAAVQRDLKQNGTKNLGFISCPGGTRVKDRPGKPGEICECSLLVYEIDGLPKDQQWGLWEKAGLDPTLVMDTGNNSLHVWFRLAKPLTPQQGRDARERLSLAIEKHLPEGVKTDTAMHSTHQPARLAGGIHPKSGNRSTIVLETGKIHASDELLALLPELLIDTKTTNATGCVWRENPADTKTANFNWDANAHHLQGITVPLEVALGETTIQDIENGVAAGSGRRAARAWSIAKTVQCAEAQLNELGVPFTGTAHELFERFVVNSGIDVDYCHGDVDGAFDRYWESDDIGEGDLSRAALCGRLEAIDWEHRIKNPAPGGLIWKARQATAKFIEMMKQGKIVPTKTAEVDYGLILSNGLEEIQQSGLGGADLTAKLLNLACATGQPYHSIRKAWDEFCGGVLDREMFESVLDQMLTGKEPMTSVEELAGKDFHEKVIVDFQRQFECDPMVVLLTVMSAMGTVLPLKTKVRGLSHTQHWRPGVLFVMILMISGGKKSMLLEELVEKPIVGGEVGWQVNDYRREAVAALKAIEKENGMSLPAFANAHQWMQDWANNVDSEFPDKLMHLVSDFTGEGIDRNAMANHNFPGYRIGTLLTTDEGRQLMGGDRYKSGGSGSAGSKYTMDKLKRAWDGKGPASVRGNKSLERNYDHIRLGILAFIQPEVYDEIASDETDDACGFWPRFVAYEADPVQLRDDLTPAERRDINQTTTFRKYLDDLYASVWSLHTIPLNLEREVLFEFSEDAEDWWYPVQCQIDRESLRETRSGDGVMGRLLGKLPAIVVDVALLLHLLKLHGQGQLNKLCIGSSGATHKITQYGDRMQNRCRVIPLETVKAAYTLCRQLMLRTAKQRNRSQGDGSGDRAQFLVKVQATAMKLDPDQKGLPVGQLQKGWSGAYLKKHPETKDLIYQALGALADRDLGELSQSTSNNRGGFRYRWIKEVVN